MYYVYAHKLEGEIKYIGKDQAWQLAIEWRKLNAY